MEHCNTLPGSIGPGSLMTIVTFEDGSPKVWAGTVRTILPFAINLNEDPMLAKEQVVLLLAQVGGEIVRAEARYQQRNFVGNSWVLEFEPSDWGIEERRKTMRHPCQVRTRLRVAGDDEHSDFEAAIAEFTDIGLGGGWIQSPFVLPVGSLLHWKLLMKDKSYAEGLALVARSSEELGGMGVEFIEFFGNSRSVVAELISPQAA